MNRVHKPMPLGKRIAWLFTKKGLPSLAAIVAGAAIGWFTKNGAVGLVLAAIAGFLVLTAFKKLPIRLTPWQALVIDISPVVAKLCFMMIILLPVMGYMTLPTGQTPDTLTKYVSIVLALPKNLISGAPANDVFPGVPVVVLLSVALMVWGSMNLGRIKMWVIALAGLLLFTLSPTIATATHGHPNLRLDFSLYSWGYFLAWFGLIWIMVSKLLPKILKTAPSKTSAAGALGILPPIIAYGLLSQHGSTMDPGFHLPLLGSFDFESMHHGIADGFSAGFAGIGGAAIVEESGEEWDGEFSGNDAPPEEEVPEEEIPEEPPVPAGPQPSTDPDDPPGTTVETDKQGNMIKRTPDGVVGTKYTDGTTYTVAKDGSSYTTYPDGTTKEYSPEDGLTVKHPDGTSETTLPDGRTGGVTVNADGSIEIKSPYGGTIYVPKDGSPEGSVTAADGTQYGVSKDGSVSITTPGGGTMTMDADGNMSGTMRTPEGDTIIAKPDGTIEATTADGDKITIDEEGLKAKFADGSHLNMDNDGNITSAHLKDKDGTIDIKTDENGTHINDDQGNSADIHKDGSVDMKGADGSTASSDAHGNATINDGKGTTMTAKSDGSGSVFDKKGNRIDLHKDGSMTVKEASGKSQHYTPDEVGQLKAKGEAMLNQAGGGQP